MSQSFPQPCLYSLLQDITSSHPHVELAALSPQVASALQQQQQQQYSGKGEVHVLMPTLGFSCSNDCWEGVAVQGRCEGDYKPV
jgi:hypothetical protein